MILKSCGKICAGRSRTSSPRWAAAERRRASGNPEKMGIRFGGHAYRRRATIGSTLSLFIGWW
jgi:hypothetical protein